MSQRTTTASTVVRQIHIALANVRRHPEPVCLQGDTGGAPVLVPLDADTARELRGAATQIVIALPGAGTVRWNWPGALACPS